MGLTVVAILLGVAMISGTYVLTDQIQHAFNDIFKTAYQKTSVVVTPKSSFTWFRGLIADQRRRDEKDD